ncbi:MAG: MgtC/SapB family protein [Clostridia bacterium]|nr:MgtC/SapB family protein [Clostridia bacterium]
MEHILEVLEGFNSYSVAFRILLATVIGGCIGSERGRHGRAAGLRTHILVCVGAAMTTLIGLYSTIYLGSNGDPMRIGAQVISGMGFLGAGTIMVRNKSHVTGLTTAAGLWATGCLGLAIGAGFYMAVIPAFLVIMATITVFIHLERATKPRHRGAFYIEMADMRSARAFYEGLAVHIAEVEIMPAKSGMAGHVGLEVTTDSMDNSRHLMRAVSENKDVIIATPLHS